MQLRRVMLCILASWKPVSSPASSFAGTTVGRLRLGAERVYLYTMPATESRKAGPQGAQLWPLSVKAYHALGELGLIPEKTELLYGQIFHKMPKSPLHSLLLIRLLELLRRVVPAGFHVRQEHPITCADSEPEPDLSVVTGAPADYANAHPRTAELVIEVCVSSHEYDRGKLRAYASAGVKEVWLVLAPEKQVEVFRQPQDERFAENALLGPKGSVSSAAVPQFVVELDGLFAA
jgi:Uma2 family endonuclease